MSTLSILPSHYDMRFILEKMNGAGVVNHFGYSIQEDGIHLRYRAEDFDTVQAILDSYPTVYADEILRDNLRDAVTQKRWIKQQTVPNFNGNPLIADDTTIGRIMAALDLMDRNPDLPQSRNWKVSENNWAELDYATIEAMGRAIGIHIQACFDNEKVLHEQINAAVDIDELASIDTDSGWPA